MPVPLLEERGVLRNLLFMHGWAGSGAYFDETLKHLELTGLRAVTVDSRGPGGSGKSFIKFVLIPPYGEERCLSVVQIPIR